MAFYKGTGKKIVSFTLPILFAPEKERSLLESYPELKEIPAFRDVSSKELKFVWYYSILFKNVEPEKDRIQMSIYEVYGNVMAEDDKQKLIIGNWTDKLRRAMSAMEGYNLSARLKCKLMYEQIFNDYQLILNEGIPKPDDDTKKIEERQKYIALTKTIQEMLPTLVKNMESSLGISDIEVDFFDNNDLTDVFYKQKKETQETDSE